MYEAVDEHRDRRGPDSDGCPRAAEGTAVSQREAVTIWRPIERGHVNGGSSSESPEEGAEFDVVDVGDWDPVACCGGADGEARAIGGELHALNGIVNVPPPGDTAVCCVVEEHLTI